MGYLSQKKHQIRENLFLNVTSVVLTFFTLLSLINLGFDFSFPNLFQLYVFSFLMFGYSLIVKKYKISLIFIMLFLINYTALSASGNIFLSESYDGKQKIELVFDENLEISSSLPKDSGLAGSLVLADNITAPFIKGEKNHPITIIKVDLRKIKSDTRKRIFNQLRNFIIKQDGPVVVYGEFGVPSWNKHLKKFMLQTRLSVKNRVFLTKSSYLKFFTMPSFYVLGFNNMGIDNLRIEESKSSSNIKFDLIF